MEKKNKTLTNDLGNKVDKPAKKVIKKAIPKLNKSALYTFISNGKAERLPKGSVWSVTGETAEIFLKMGYGNLKE